MIATKSTEPRIPIALQNVFLSSNRGDEVLQPPPQNVASRTFFRWRGRDVSPPQATPLSSPVKMMPKLVAFGSPFRKPKQQENAIRPAPLTTARRTKSDDSPKKAVSMTFVV